MYLKEFELDLPYASDADKIIQFLNENDFAVAGKNFEKPIEWKWIRRLFVLETRCITAMFDRLFGKYKTKECRKILVECVDIIESESVLNFSGIYVVQVKFNFMDFILLSDLEKKHYSLRLLKEGIEKITRIKKWDFTPFDSVFTKIIEKNYVNEWVWARPSISPNKKYTAEVVCQHEVKSMNIFFLIKDIKKNEITRKMIISEQPHEFAYAQHLGVIDWISEDVVTLLNKQGDKEWELDINRLSD